MPLSGQSSASVHLLHPGRLAAVDDPMSIAVEHVRWCRSHGDSFAEIIKSVGFVPSGEADFDETVCILAAAVSRSSA
jgi:hypothetical protein